MCPIIWDLKAAALRGVIFIFVYPAGKILRILIEININFRQKCKNNMEEVCVRI